MSCINGNCQACRRLTPTQALTYDTATDTLQINLPDSAYFNCQRLCILIAQNIPTDTTIDSPVVFTIGDDTTNTYQFVNMDGTPIYATQLSTRRLYPVRVRTAPTTGVFVYTGRCLPNNNVTVSETIPVPTTVTNGGDATKGGNTNG